MEEALGAVEEALRLQALGQATNSPRQRVRLPAGWLHLMAAAIPGQDALGFKAYCPFSGGGSFLFFLYSASTGKLLAVMDSMTLGNTRTGAASGVSAKHLARKGTLKIGIFGSGIQARSQLSGLVQVRRVSQIKAYSRNSVRLENFAKEMTKSLGIPVQAMANPLEVVQGANVVITATTSAFPLFEGDWLEEGTHVIAMGSNMAIKRELDERTVQRADVIVVDSKEQSRIEAGDLISPTEMGLLHWERVRELGEVISGRHAGRTSDKEITLFKSNGIALEDVAVGIKTYEKAKKQGVGRKLPF
jgi:ornithine cyclodeaminase/alanine dehydrogenase-like protein (mu-crystallin family)